MIYMYIYICAYVCSMYVYICAYVQYVYICAMRFIHYTLVQICMCTHICMLCISVMRVLRRRRKLLSLYIIVTVHTLGDHHVI